MKPWIAGLYSVIVFLVPATTFAQAAPVAPPKAAPSKPESMAATAPAKASTQAARAAPVRRSRAHMDARECLDRGSIVAITKCAEKFL